MDVGRKVPKKKAAHKPDVLEIVVSGKPVPMGRPRLTFRGGFARAYLPASTKDYLYLVETSVRASSARTGWKWYEGDTYSLVVHFFGARASADIDNLVKSIMDGLTMAGVIEDDKYVFHLTATKATDKGNPRAEIILRRYGK